MRTHGIKPGELLWQSDFSASVDKDSKWTATQSFECYLADVVKLFPKRRSPCQEPGFGFMGLDSATVENIEGGMARVECRYVGSGEDGNFDFDSASEEGKRKELAIATGEEPVESHDNYKSISEADMLNIQNLKAGRLKPIKNEPGKYLLEISDSEHEPVSFTGAAAELAEKLNRGVSSYLAANQIYRLSYTSKFPVGSAVMNKVGKVTSAPGAPSAGGGRDWLFVGATQIEQGNAYQITLEWRLSGSGGWDPDLY